MNVELVDPAGITILAGTVAADWLLSRVTLRPPVGAGPVRATVAVEVPPPVRAVGLKVKLLRADTVTVRDALRVVVPSVPEMEATV